ncbi:intracellular hyaluronan-binding protein 4-like isoform X1 [Syngnathus typhle]|uniref:intracellular hyaluronan-binding protein 4-like isoform X1 n=1 Tax=Syngnathus typhle TaxID=161592 RepID=UPI002A6B0F2A|nr:intracellular hyaluronan-binding protein 4-like isoform X1 [Syngnathus typhle]XP_061135783.1 intracellular hyaluronan-binding protein 4-like isoform X1 [Syngnathus typhle]
MLPDAYGCVVANRFGNLPDDDSDPLDLISEVEREQERKRKKKKEEDEQKAKQKKSGQKESQRDRRTPIIKTALPEPVAVSKQPARNRGDERAEAKRGSKMADCGERRANPAVYPQEFSVAKPSNNRDTDFKSRGGGRGGRGGRGGYTRNSDYFVLRGKREYDRHNGSGISPDEKRGGRGPWNWGCVEEPAGRLMDVITDAQVHSEEPQAPVEENQNIAVPEEEEEMLVQVAVEMTLDEWKALQEVSRPKAEFNIRKPDNKIPSKAKVIHKSKHVEHLKGHGEGMEDEGTFLRRSVNDITSLLDINFGSLGRPPRGGRGRGARGGLSSYSERDQATLEKVGEVAPDPDNQEDFPELSAGR